uniref:Retrovirus-related Pol polyprotein from transposon 17.6 n=1 Tax=Bactrocera latifrons TaxID=174628 RepID=A0A0K8W1B3_BACLA
MEENDQKKTAFSTPTGHYEIIRISFGLKNSPSTFQRLINAVLREYINKICVVYLDDMFIFSTSIEEHMNSIKQIFLKLRKHNLKIQVDKSNFFCKETQYLGHTLTSKGIKINSTKVEAIQKLNIPHT